MKKRILTPYLLLPWILSAEESSGLYAVKSPETGRFHLSRLTVEHAFRAFWGGYPETVNFMLTNQ